MTFIAKVFVFATLVVSFGYWGSRFLHAQLSSVARIPPVTIAFEAYSAGGTMELVEAYRDDGSKALSSHQAGNPYPPLVEVTDITRGRYFVKDSLTKYFDEVPFVSSLKTPLLQRPLTCSEAVGPSGSCGVTSGDLSILVGERIEWGSITISDGTVLRIAFARDLGFLPLFRQKPARGTGKMSTVQATSIVRGDPDPALFTLPDDYIKAKSSAEFMSVVLRARGQAEQTPEAADRLDRMQRDKWAQAQKKDLERHK